MDARFIPAVVTVPPPTTPVTVAEAKAHLRVEHPDDDALIEVFLKAAVATLDGPRGVLGRCLITQTLQQDFTGFAPALCLPCDAVSITSVTNGGTTVPSDLYAIAHHARGSAVVPVPGAVWPVAASGAQPVSVTFVSGYGDAAVVPAPLKVAILIHTAFLYENRGAQNQGVMPMAYGMLIEPFMRRPA